MDRIPKLRMVAAVVLVVCVCSTLTLAAKPNWQRFWSQFSEAVNKKDGVALKSLMTSERDFFDGGGGGSRDQWIQMMFRESNWQELRKSVASGTMPHPDAQGSSRITKDRFLIFSVVNGRWRFVGVMGD